MKIKKIAKDIIYIHAGSMEPNIYLINNDTLIDTGLCLHKERLIKCIKSVGIEPENIKTIINTHCHHDHTSANVLFTNAKILIHEKDAFCIESGDSLKTGAFMFGKEAKKQKISLKLHDNDSIRIGDVKFTIINTPGHTDGSICIYDEKRQILFSGDTIFSETYGRVDLESGSKKDMKNSIEKLLSIKIKTLLPGHGDVIENNEHKINTLLHELKKEVY
ncbi:MAG: MBL fold metallo-hydrolase [DPANN group archaeon]|nr:MBL fold metallo-hydrolase [DPANN group archaeon]